MSCDTLGKWLEGRPQIIQELARKFPPGTTLKSHGETMFVVAYNEDGSLSVSDTNPGVDYEKAVATRKPLCACCLAKFT